MSNQAKDKPEQANQPDSARADAVNVPVNSTTEKATAGADAGATAGADAGKVFLEEANGKGKAAQRGLWHTIRVPLLAVLTGLIVGGIFIILTTESVYQAFGQSFFGGLYEAGRIVLQSYGALFTGSLGDPVRIINALFSG
ncbi:MAG: hypothetical protein EHM39_09140, partial [Chloroflexi bacterium]